MEFKNQNRSGFNRFDVSSNSLLFKKKALRVLTLCFVSFLAIMLISTNVVGGDVVEVGNLHNLTNALEDGNETVRLNASIDESQFLLNFSSDNVTLDLDSYNLSVAMINLSGFDNITIKGNSPESARLKIVGMCFGGQSHQEASDRFTIKGLNWSVSEARWLGIFGENYTFENLYVNASNLGGMAFNEVNATVSNVTFVNYYDEENQEPGNNQTHRADGFTILPWQETLSLSGDINFTQEGDVIFGGDNNSTFNGSARVNGKNNLTIQPDINIGNEIDFDFGSVIQYVKNFRLLEQALELEFIDTILVNESIDFDSFNIERGVVVRSFGEEIHLNGSNRIRLKSNESITLEGFYINTTMPMRLLSEDNTIKNNIFLGNNTAINVNENYNQIINNTIKNVVDGEGIRSAVILRGNNSDDEHFVLENFTMVNNTVVNNQIALQIQNNETFTNLDNIKIEGNNFTTNISIPLPPQGPEVYANVMSVNHTSKSQAINQSDLLTRILESDNEFNESYGLIEYSKNNIFTIASLKQDNVVENVDRGTIYPTIQDAIDAANEGDTIEVNSGVYNESLSIHKSLTLKSTSGASETLINGTENITIFVMNTDDVGISGFNITNSVNHSIAILNSSDINISDNVMVGNNESFGIVSFNSTTDVIRNNFSNSRVSIFLNENSTSYVYSNNIFGIGNELFEGFPPIGILIKESTINSFENNVYNNFAGIVSFVSEFNDDIWESNTFSNNTINYLYVEDEEDPFILEIDFLGKTLLEISDDDLFDTSSVNVLEEWIIEVGNVSVTIPEDTEITRLGDGNFDIFNLSLSDLDKSEVNITGLDFGDDALYSSFKFGIPDFGLEFSNPINIKIGLNETLNGFEFSVYKTDWDGDGNVNSTGINCIIQDGECNFQISEASEFALVDKQKPAYTDIDTRLPYEYNETNNYWFNITLKDPSGVDNASLYLRNSTESFKRYNMTNHSDGVWSYNVTNLTAATYHYRFWANDTLGNAGNITSVSTFRVAVLEDDESVLDNEEYEVPANRTRVVVDNTDKVRNISVPSNSTDSVSLNLNNSRADNKVRFNNNVSLRRSTVDKNLSVDIPSNTTMSSSDDWDGDFKLPETTDVDDDDKDVSLAVSVGSDKTQLDFTNPVKVRLQGQGEEDKKIGWKRGDGDITEIQECGSKPGSGGAASKPDSGESCYYKEGQDIVVWTYHFTTFLSYEEIDDDDDDDSPTTTTRTRTKTVVKESDEEVDEEEEVVDEEEDEEEVEEEEEEEVVEEEDEEEVTEDEDEVVEEEEEVVDEEEEEVVDDEPRAGIITGLFAGENPVANTIIGLVALVGLTILVYYGSFTSAGLSLRAERLHRKADRLQDGGNYNKSIDKRNKARELQKKADKRNY